MQRSASLSASEDEPHMHRGPVRNFTSRIPEVTNQQLPIQAWGLHCSGQLAPLFVMAAQLKCAVLLEAFNN